MKLNKMKQIFTAASLLILSAYSKASKLTDNPKADEVTRPNIVIIFADDMGYGDIGVYNSESLIPTPNLDHLASQGMIFTDAHTSSSVCSPSRYSLLTGRYAWRSSLKSGVLWGYSPLLIEPEIKTLPKLLQDEGYHTAGIGKWHLGLGYDEAGYFDVAVSEDADALAGLGLTPGPNEVGFDYFFGIPASLDMRPYLYIENGRPFTPLKGKITEASDLARNGGDGFWRKGQVAEGFAHDEVLNELTSRTLDFIKEQKPAEKPFFLYFALPAPHTPWLPNEPFRGKSGAGHYGDFAHQVDDVVGRVNQALLEAGLADDTIVIYSSDNGAHWLDSDIEKYGHLANGHLRGQKADIYEGGHRVPLIISWPEKILKGEVSSQPTVLTDVMATLAGIIGSDMGNAGADSFDLSPILFDGSERKIDRAPMIHHAYNGMFAIREGDWKLILGLGSGGFTVPVTKDPIAGEQNVRLYNLKSDIKETEDLANKYPKVVERLTRKLENMKQEGTSH